MKATASPLSKMLCTGALLSAGARPAAARAASVGESAHRSRLRKRQRVSPLEDEMVEAALEWGQGSWV